MFKYIKLKNYKSLVDVYADFTGKRNRAKNIILIYGENGAGKSNLASAFFSLFQTTQTRSSLSIQTMLLEKIAEEQKNGINIQFPKELLNAGIKTLIKDCRTIDAEGNTVIEAGFTYKNKEGIYRIEMDDEQIVSEKMDFILNKNKAEYFSITPKKKNINENIFKTSGYYKEFYQLIEQYWGKHSLLSILFYEIETKAKDYIKKQITANFYDIYDMFSNISFDTEKSQSIRIGHLSCKHKYMDKIERGVIDLNEQHRLIKMEKFADYFFTRTYSDIKKAYYKTEIKDGKIFYRLYFQKLIAGKIKDIDFQLESTGTRRLLEILPYLLTAAEGGVVILDEFDANIHDILIKNIVECLNSSIKGQAVITTHNTCLLESEELPKDSIYIFSLDAYAGKKVIPITEIEDRIHPNINIRKRYFHGIYGGIPAAMDVDFEDLSEALEDE